MYNLFSQEGKDPVRSFPPSGASQLLYSLYLYYDLFVLYCYVSCNSAMLLVFIALIIYSSVSQDNFLFIAAFSPPPKVLSSALVDAFRLTLESFFSCETDSLKNLGRVLIRIMLNLLINLNNLNVYYIKSEWIDIICLLFTPSFKTLKFYTLLCFQNQK